MEEDIPIQRGGVAAGGDPQVAASHLNEEEGLSVQDDDYMGEGASHQN